jgi:tRNA pseudouridine55 synthase
MTTPDVARGGTPAAGHGVLRLDKPVGPTSHDAVAAVRRALRTRRVGHTGTLDPFASGLLLICVGPATRAAEYLSGLDKRYTANVRLGVATDTDDLTGAVIGGADPAGVTPAAVERVLAEMRGTFMQRPPAYSAKKRAGERAHAAARAGRPLDLDAVPVSIHELTVTAFDLPHVELDVHCGSGTYVRALARDVGEALGVGGHLTSLRRTAVGAHSVEGAVPLGELADGTRVAAALLSTAEALSHLPHIQLDARQVTAVRHGRAIPAAGPPTSAEACVVLVADGDVVAIGERRGADIRPRKVFQ